jgi:DNA-binding MarR family transcriptional regulator
MRIGVEGFLALAVIWQMGEATPTDVRDKSGLASGTVSPLLRRLQKAGVLSARKEAADPHILKRPARVFYSVAEGGIEHVREAAQPLSEALGTLSHA